MRNGFRSSRGAMRGIIGATVGFATVAIGFGPFLYAAFQGSCPPAPLVLVLVFRLGPDCKTLAFAFKRCTLLQGRALVRPAERGAVPRRGLLSRATLISSRPPRTGPGRPGSRNAPPRSARVMQSHDPLRCAPRTQDRALISANQFCPAPRGC